MKLKETDTKKLASLVVNHENGYLLQKECLVDLQTGDVTVGEAKIKTSKYDTTSKITGVEINYRGQSYDLDINNNNYKVKNMGGFIMESIKPETIKESKLKNINPTNAAWKH